MAVEMFVGGCDGYRESLGRPTITELDAAERFSGRLHVAGEHASLLTFACSVADRLELSEELEVVGVTGNSMGWYTALGLAGALAMDDTVRLVETMASYQAGNQQGGQIIYPLTHPDFAADPTLPAAVDAALEACRAAGHEAWWSIHLGAFAVLGASATGVKFLLEALPEVKRGQATFPRQLPMHSAFHTPLLADASRRAHVDLAELAFRAPKVPLFDGHGHVFLPHTASADAIRDYTLGAQVVEPFDFRLALSTALAHCGADVVVMLGPGNSLGAPAASILLQEGWYGMSTKQDLASADPPRLLSFAREEQRALLT